MILVQASIDFDDELRSRSEEIDDIISDSMLPPNVDTF